MQLYICENLVRINNICSDKTNLIPLYLYGEITAINGKTTVLVYRRNSMDREIKDFLLRIANKKHTSHHQYTGKLGKTLIS